MTTTAVSLYNDLHFQAKELHGVINKIRRKGSCVKTSILVTKMILILPSPAKPEAPAEAELQLYFQLFPTTPLPTGKDFKA